MPYVCDFCGWKSDSTAKIEKHIEKAPNCDPDNDKEPWEIY